MSLRRFSLLLIVFLVLVEVGLAVWKNSDIAPSNAPVFTWPQAVARFGQPGELAGPIKTLHADRGAECRMDAPGGIHLDVMYFECDPIRVGPMMGFTAHTPEVCNVGIGYNLLGIDPPRSYEVLGKLPITFDCTRFSDPSGHKVFVFKTVWVQGIGSMELREGFDRMLRFKNAFVRHVGAARIVEAGIFDARDVDEAWEVFRRQVLDQLVWR